MGMIEELLLMAKFKHMLFSSMLKKTKASERSWISHYQYVVAAALTIPIIIFLNNSCGFEG